MSLKESPTKFKHKRRRGSCLSSCFSGSPVDESGDLESKSLEASCLSWSWFRKKKKKKTVPVTADSPSHSTAEAAQGKGERDKPHNNRHKAKSNRPRSNSKPQVQVQQHQHEKTANINSASSSQGTNSLPRISVMYGTGSQLPNLVRTRTRTRHVGSSELNQLSIADEKSDHPANLDHLVGLSVLVVTLAVMLVWGRACAVGCLCACFYLVPLLRTTTVTAGSSRGTENTVKVDIESEAYKKRRVVLEGLLERNGRRLSVVNSFKAPNY